MSQTILAIFENGVFKPLEALSLPEHEQVRLQFQPVSGQPLPGPPASDSPESNGLTVRPEDDPLAGIRVATGISDLAENFDDYRFGNGPSS